VLPIYLRLTERPTHPRECRRLQPKIAAVADHSLSGRFGRGAGLFASASPAVTCQV
jgi:hypothetical protein